MLEMDDKKVNDGNAHQNTNNVVILCVVSVDDQYMKKTKADQGLYPSPQSIIILIQIKCAIIVQL